MDKDKGKASSTWRTSQQAWLASDATPQICDISARVSAATRTPLGYQEALQVLHYGLSGKYDAHLDAFDPQFYATQHDFLARIENGHRNRLATAFWYMTDVEDGGETIFPRAGCLPPPSETNVDNLRRDKIGLLVTPKRGKIIIFYNLLPSGVIDQYSLHGGCPVIAGDKWAANKWIWNNDPM